MSKPATIYINRQATSSSQVCKAFDIIRTPSVTLNFTINAILNLIYFVNEEETEQKITSNKMSADEIEALENTAKINLLWRSRCTVEMVFELIPSTLNLVKNVKDEEEFLKVINSIRRYVENGHTVDIEHLYNFCNGEGATIEKITSYRLELGGLPMIRRMAVRNNLKKTQCRLVMKINIKFK